MGMTELPSSDPGGVLGQQASHPVRFDLIAAGSE